MVGPGDHSMGIPVENSVFILGRIPGIGVFRFQSEIEFSRNQDDSGGKSSKCP